MSAQTKSPDAAGPNRDGSLSRGVEVLIASLAKSRCDTSDVDFDAVIVGSGYGGSVAAARLAGATRAGAATPSEPIRVCVLERGNQYVAGSFPSTMSELAGHVRFNTPGYDGPRGRSDGLFDIRVGPDVSAVVVNGLGGGSLINAGVMKAPRTEVFARGWPRGITLGNLQPYYDTASAMLGAAGNRITDQRPGDSACTAAVLDPPMKYRALEALARGAGASASFEAAQISIAIRTAPNQQGVPRAGCVRCGDCATGCNFGAKQSLDINYLAQAWQNGAEIYTGATVIDVVRQGDGSWLVGFRFTDRTFAPYTRQRYELRARRLILAAGTFGSTEIMMRSQRNGLRFSRQLGRRFSTNGDAIAVAYDQRVRVNAAGLESQAPCERQVGPTITGMFRSRDAESGLEIVVQELGIPAPLRRAFEEVVTTAAALYTIDKPDRTRHSAGPLPDPSAVDQGKLGRTSILAAFGDDGADGQLRLTDPSAPAGAPQDPPPGDGNMVVDWPQLSSRALFEAQIRVMQRACDGNPGPGGTVVPNPLWRLLSPALSAFVDNLNGPLVTAHPLGGCAMADCVADGVTDEYGRVFDAAAADPTQTFEGLVVLDGSVIPTSLGINPSLTITAVSERALNYLMRIWELAPAASGSNRVPTGYQQLPMVPNQPPPPPAPTNIRIVERMKGELPRPRASRASSPLELLIKLTYCPVAARDLAQTVGKRVQVESGTVYLRSLAQADPLDDDSGVVAEAPVTGEICFFDRVPSGPSWRRIRGSWAWLWNRGLRDAWTLHTERAVEGDAATRARPVSPSWFSRLSLLWRLASRAGAVRVIDYTLRIQTPTRDHEGLLAAAGQILGRKSLTYARRANPWRQLTELRLHRFPGRSRPAQSMTVSLDLPYLARREIPLVKVVDQQDQPTALADLATLLLYLLRMMLGLHLLGLRDADPPPAAPPDRLPGAILGNVQPEVTLLQVDDRSDPNDPIYARLSRYRPPDLRAERPVLMIHGYTAGGNTFTHPFIRKSLAAYLYERGFDVWVVDLRTSHGLDYARRPWTFEDVAYADIPIAIDHICCATGSNKIDVVAHCMGAAMFSMAVLEDPAIAGGTHRIHQGPAPTASLSRLRSCLPERIGAAVLSQVGPALVMSPSNRFRGYVMSYLKAFLGINYFDIASIASQGLFYRVIDRFLATMPYPIDEWCVEQPAAPPCALRPFTAARHRLDVLTGRTMLSSRINLALMDRFADLFGVINLHTVSQPIAFARYDTITDSHGTNRYVSRENLRRRFAFPVLSFHGSRNGLTDPSTLDLMQEVFDDAFGPNPSHFRRRLIDGFGHQDCLIGDDAAERVFPFIEEFLREPRQSALPAADPEALPRRRPLKSWLAPAMPWLKHVTPWLGPVTGWWRSEGEGVGARLSVLVGGHPGLGAPFGWAACPVARDGADGRFELAGQITWQAATRESWDDCVALELPRLPPPAEGRATGYLLIALHDMPALQGRAAPPDWVSAAVKELLREPAEFHRALARGYIDFSGFNAANLDRRDAHPDGLSQSLCFAFASCQYPPGPADRDPAYASLTRLARRLNAPEGQLDKPQLVFLVGDQIYADATAGVFDAVRTAGPDRDQYDQPYEDLYRRDEVSSALRRVPVYLMLNAHEIRGGWEPRVCDLPTVAVDAFWRHQRRIGPPAPGGMPAAPGGPYWYALYPSGMPFFAADTRTERGMRSVESLDQVTIVSESQFDALCRWLEGLDRDLPKLIVSPSVFLPTRKETRAWPASAVRSDGWDGFPASFHRLLAFIAERRLENVVFLSGDAHLSCVSRAELSFEAAAPERSTPVVVHSIISSALYAPYPFANDRQGDLLADGSFEFSWPPGGTTGQCGINTYFPCCGDAFAVVRIGRNSQGWNLTVEFEGARERCAGEVPLNGSLADFRAIPWDRFRRP